MSQSVLESSVADAAAMTAPLVLGHRNGPRAGEIVQLTKAKCYLGAGSLGTSDSPKPNLAGVHCLILRGPQQTVVRRWSQSTRLNGRPFDDATLKTGDRLQLGAIELELLADASEETLTEWRLQLSDRVEDRRVARESVIKSRESELARRAAGLERNEFGLQQKTEQTLQLAQELQQRRVLLDELAGEVCARENEIKRREAANAQLRIELDSQAEALDCVNQQLNEKRVATELEQAKLADIFRARTAAWEVQQAADAAILAARETAIAQAETRFAERNAQIAATPQADARQSDLDQERQSIERERLKLEEASTELEQARDEINNQREGLLNEQRRQKQLEAALADRAAQIEQAEAERFRQSDVLEKRRIQLETETRQLSEQRTAFEETQRSAAHAQAESMVAKDQVRSEADTHAAAELERRRCELAELQQQLADRESQFEERLASYADERAEFAARHEQCDELHLQLQSQQHKLAERDSELEQRRQGLEQQLVEHQQRLESIATQQQNLTDRAAELDAIAVTQAELLESRREELARTQANFAAESSSRQLELEATQARLEAAQHQHTETTEVLERQRAEIANRQAAVDEQKAELATKDNEVAERERLLAEREQLLAERESMTAPLPPASSAEVENLDVDSAAPESTEAVFRRLGVLSILRETSEEPVSDDSERSAVADAPPESIAAEPETTDTPVESAASSEPVNLDEVDESQIIERYMSQLLSRVRGGTADATPAASFVKLAKKPSLATAQLPSTRADQPVLATSCECPVETKEERPAPAAQRHARPSSSDISAMRDLANQSAQAAIDTHSRGILLNDLYVKTIICLVGIVSGVVLLSWVPQIGWIGLLAGAACFLGSAVWGIKLGLLFREFLKASGVAGLGDGEADADTTVIAPAHHQSTESTGEAD